MVAHYIICYQKITTNLYYRIENSIVLFFHNILLEIQKLLIVKRKYIYMWSKREGQYLVFNFHISTKKMLLLYITFQ
jgi:hypothetical protein